MRGEEVLGGGGRARSSDGGPTMKVGLVRIRRSWGEGGGGSVEGRRKIAGGGRVRRRGEGVEGWRGGDGTGNKYKGEGRRGGISGCVEAFPEGNENERRK